jgi:type IV pilus assembly protein PilB
MAARIKLGELLVQAKIITPVQLQETLELQKQEGRRLGTLLVEREIVSERQVTQILSQQLSVPWVSLYHTDFSRQLLNHVPRELAERHCLIPIFIRRVRGYGDVLYVAMDDPSNEIAQEEISKWSGLVVRSMIAPPSEIRSAIAAYYGDSLTPDHQADPASLGSVLAAPATPKITPLPSAPLVAASIPPEESDAPVIEAREISMPPPKHPAATKMVTLTLLDGTKINLPRVKGPVNTEATGEEVLTARDMVAALRAVAHGADATEILGENVNWQAMFAALLSLLLKKHLVADWEFVEEFKKV